MTLLLDRARFVRMVPTGSLTTYCLEFQKPDGSYVYALWCADDEVDVFAKLAGGDLHGVTITDMLGRRRDFLEIRHVNVGQGKDTIEKGVSISSSPVYLSTAKPIGELEARHSSQPPTPHSSPLPLTARVVQSLTSTNEVTVVCGRDPRIEIGRDDPPFLAFFRPGEFAIRPCSSQEMLECGGSAIAFTRTTTNDCPELVQEYAFLRFPKAKPAPGEPSSVGVWVKGNSSWGKIYFEVTDAEGEKWLSAGTGGYGCMVYDWPEKAALRFDGWKFVQMPLTKDSPVKIYSPGENEWQWQRDGDFGNGRIDYPITVTGLGVGMYPRVLNILEMEETPRTILIGDIMVY